MARKPRWSELVEYDETSSTFLRWKISPCYRVKAGSEVGSKNSRGYMKTSYKGSMEMLHRIVWMLHNGEIPVGYVIDHIDGDKTNNSICNLRLATQSQNNLNTNQKRYSFNKRSKKWRVFVSINGKQTYCGSFEDEEVAKKVSIELQSTHYGEFFHGKI